MTFTEYAAYLGALRGCSGAVPGSGAAAASSWGTASCCCSGANSGGNASAPSELSSGFALDGNSGPQQRGSRGAQHGCNGRDAAGGDRCSAGSCASSGRSADGGNASSGGACCSSGEGGSALLQGSCWYLKDWHCAREIAGRFAAYQLPTYFREDWLNDYYDSRSAAAGSGPGKDAASANSGCCGGGCDGGGGGEASSSSVVTSDYRCALADRCFAFLNVQADGAGFTDWSYYKEH